MRRFIYDAILLILLVLIGVSMSDVETVDKQNELDKFEEKVKSEQVVSDIEKRSSLNQIEENKAAYMAKNTSSFLKDCVNVTVKSLSNIFNMLVE